MASCKKLILLLCAAVTASALMTGCLTHGNQSSTPVYFNSLSQHNTEDISDFINKYNNEATMPSSPLTAEYQGIYDEYCEALISQGAVLQSELSSTMIDYEQIDSILDEKSAPLETLFNEGNQKITEVYKESNNADRDEYEYWSEKLRGVYEDELSQLRDTVNYFEPDDESKDEDYDY